MELEQQKEEQKQKKGNNRTILGVVLVGFGGLLLAANFGFISESIKDVIFTWQMLLIGIGTLNILVRGNMQTGMILIAIGGFFLLPDLFGYTFDRKVFWPLLFVIVGLILIFVRKRSWNRERKGSSEHFFDTLSIFSGVERKFTTQKFEGGRLTTIMGGTEIDLSKADIQGEAIIDMFVLFGGAEITAPEGWQVQIDAFSIFGACEDKRHVSVNTTGDKILRVKGFVMFGGAEIKG